jgi:hypothetical protein
LDSIVNGTSAARIVLPGGGTCTRVIDLTGDPGPQVHRIEFLHLCTESDLPGLRHTREVNGRYLAVRPRCLDCLGQPATIPPDEGFDAAVLLVHDRTCPLFNDALRQFAGGAA